MYVVTVSVVGHLNTVSSASIKGIPHVIIDHLGDAIDDTIHIATIVVAASAIVLATETTSVPLVVTST